MYVESDVIQDVKDYLANVTDTDTYFKCGLKPYGSDLWFLLFEEPNANGTLDFSRRVSFEYLQQYPEATAYILDRMENEFGEVDFEDLYEYDDALGDYVQTDYVEVNSEKIKVRLFMDIGEVLLGLCPTVAVHHDEPLDLDDEATYSSIHAEIEAININDVRECL